MSSQTAPLTDDDIEKMFGGGAAPKPKVTDADIEKMFGDPSAQLSALREPDPGTIDVNALPATSPQQSTLGSPGAAGQGWHGITDAEAAQGEQSYMGQMWRQATSPFTTAGESIQQAKEAEGTVDPALTAGIHTAGSIAFAPAAIATAPLAPVLNWVGEKLDPIARGAAWVAKGMPEGPKHLAPGQRGDMPGEGSQGVQSVRALVNLGSQYLAAKGAGAGIKALRGSPIGEAVRSEFKSVLPTYGREAAPQRTIGNPVQERAAAANAENLRRIGQAVDTKYGGATLKPQDVKVPEAAKAEMPKPPVSVVASATQPAPAPAAPEKPAPTPPSRAGEAIPADRIRALYDKGDLAPPQIAEKLGVDPSVVERVLFSEESAPAPAKPAEAPPSPPPASGQAPAAPAGPKKWYHGSGTKGLTTDALDVSTTAPDSLMGYGVYLTDNPDIAASYAKVRSKRTGTPTIYEATVEPKRVLDADQPAPAEVRAAVAKQAKYVGDGTGENVARAVADPNATTANLIRAFKEDLRASQADQPRMDAGEVSDVMGSLADAIGESGYDAITHRGGQRVGKARGGPEHQVMVPLGKYDAAGVWRPSAIKSFSERAPAAPSAPDVPAAPPRTPDPSGGGAAGPPTMGNRSIGKGGSESGAVRIPTGKEVVQAYDTAEATGQKAYQAVTHPIADAVSKIVDAIPGVKRLRQWGIHESLAIDPTERLYQGHERRIGRIEEGRRQAEIGARALDKATEDLGSHDATEVGKYMDGERPDLPAAAKPQQAAIDRAVADMHQTRTEMLNRNLISQAVFDEYPRFLSRIYRVMAREGRTGFGAAKIAKLSEELYRQDAHGVVVSLPEAEAAMVAQPHNPKVVTGTNAQTLLKFETPQAREAFVKDVQAWDAARRGRGPGAKEGLVVERFEPLPADVRESLGEITSPGDRFAMTLAKSRAKIATHDLLASMESMGKGQKGGDWIMPGPGSPGVKGATGPVLPNYTQVTGRGWGPLEGKYLRNDIHEYATSIVDGSSADAVSSALRGAYGQWKFDRTVGSIPTVMRNLLSSHWMSIEAGVNYLNPRNWPAWKEAIETLAGRNEARRKWATENGIITNDFYSREFKARVDRALSGNDNPVAAVWEALKASKDETLSQTAQQKIINRGASAAGEAVVNPLTAVPGAQTVKRAMGTIYSWENNSRRLAAAIKLERQGLSMPELLKKLDRITENYGRQGGAQQLAQNVPLIGPFARFTWDRYRIFKNNLVDHPVVVGETLLYSYLLKKALEAHFGKNVTDEERKAVEQEFGHQAVAMDPDKTGKVRTYDPRWTFPYGQVIAGPETDRNAGEEGRAWMNYAARILGGGLAPGIEPIMAATTGKDSRGKPVADSFTRHRLGPVGTGAEIWRQYIGPPIFGRHFDQFDAAMHGRPISTRQPVQSPEDVVLGYLTGVSLGKLDIAVARKNLAAIFRARKSEVIGDAKKRIIGGEDADATKAEARDILSPLKGNLKERKETLVEAKKARDALTDAEIERLFGGK